MIPPACVDTLGPKRTKIAKLAPFACLVVCFSVITLARRRTAKSGVAPVVVEVLPDAGASATSQTHRHTRYVLYRFELFRGGIGLGERVMRYGSISCRASLELLCVAVRPLSFQPSCAIDPKMYGTEEIALKFRSRRGGNRSRAPSRV